MALIKYRVYCTTDSVYRTTIESSSPTECPDSGHPIDTSLTIVLEVIDPGPGGSGSPPSGGGLPGPVVSIGPTAPGVFPLLGSFAHWYGKGKLGDENCYWVRSFLPEGLYDRMQCGIISGSQSSRKIDMGIYADNGANPPRPTGSLLLSTGQVSTDDKDDKFLTVPFSSSGKLSVPAGGKYYWFGITCNSGSLSLVITHQKYNKMWCNRNFVLKDDYGDVLGNLPGSFDVEDSALPYLAILLEGSDDMDGE